MWDAFWPHHFGTVSVFSSISTVGVAFGPPRPPGSTPLGTPPQAFGVTPAETQDSLSYANEPYANDPSNYASYEPVDPSGYTKYSGATAVGTKVYFTPYDEDHVGVVDTAQQHRQNARARGGRSPLLQWPARLLRAAL